MAPRKAQGKDLPPMEEITLQNDIGSDIYFTGLIFAEHSFFDEESGVLTQQKLFLTADGHQAYSIVAGDGKNKEKRAYLIRRDGQLCKINNGLFDVTVNTSDLLIVVKGLCGINETMQSRDFLEKVEDFLKEAVNG
jgi:hypothetical protein